MPITSVRGASPSKPLSPSKLPDIKVSANDPSQRVEKTADNQFTIRGVASNRGFAPSVFELSVGGKKIRIPQSGGMAPTDLAKKLQKQLPAGFKATISQLPYRPGPGARAPVSVTITKTGGAGGAGGGGRVMGPVQFAKANLASGHEITTLFTSRGSKDLLKNPAALEKLKVGEFDGAKVRGATLTNTVYKVKVAGPDDRPVSNIIVKVAVPQPNDTVKYKFVNLGPFAEPAPNV